MSDARKLSHKGMSNQPGLFEERLGDHSLDVRASFRSALSAAIRRYPHDRWRLAGEVSRLSGHEISKEMLDKATGGDYAYGMRAEDVPALIAALGDRAPIEALLAPLDIEIVGPDEAAIIRLGRLERKRAALEAEITRMKREAGIR